MFETTFHIIIFVCKDTMLKLALDQENIELIKFLLSFEKIDVNQTSVSYNQFFFYIILNIKILILFQKQLIK